MVTKAARTRQTMAAVALELFLRNGFDETTMEQIAERAEVGTTTLYRYFPTKDQLLLDPLVEAIDPAPYLRARPTDERLEISLGEALLAAAAAFTPMVRRAGGSSRRRTPSRSKSHAVRAPLENRVRMHACPATSSGWRGLPCAAM